LHRQRRAAVRVDGAQPVKARRPRRPDRRAGAVKRDQRFRGGYFGFGRFAGKEAILKALGTGLKPDITWQEIEILNDQQGKPEVYLSTRLQRSFPMTHLFVSISHCEEYATATAILVGVLNGTL